MTTTKLNAQPGGLDLALYAGDGFSTDLNFKDSEMGDPYPLPGTWQAQVRAKASDPNPLTSFTVDSSQAAEGIVKISLTGEQVRSLLASAGGIWDLQQTPPDGEPRTWLRGRVSVTWDVSRA